MDMIQGIRKMAVPAKDPAGRQVSVIYETRAINIAATHSCSLQDVYVNALKSEVWPSRYLRNRDSVSINDQIRLAESRVGVVGAGGLGGHVCLLLARIGVGLLRVIDHDDFDETNLNRQALSDLAKTGKSKAETAASTLGSVNPAVKVTPVIRRINEENAEDLLNGLDVVVDALDNVRTRFVIAVAARRLNIPLVHGAVAGFEGRVMTIFPEDQGFERLYGARDSLDTHTPSPEALLGVPSITPAIIAALQTMEVLKIILDRGRLLRNRMGYMDLEKCRLELFSFDSKGVEK